ncbi:MAG: 7-cyano-7-deazaguanine synthase [Candidatus Omnitrophica bacterium]|nr:7-cyano-7-deazaguanine synthase [Candidatus Omnitrophota bacterium]
MAGKTEKIRALVMISGGLDSSLAARILQEQGIEIEAVHFTGVIHAGVYNEYNSRARRFADKLGIKLTTFRIEDDFIKVLTNPSYGYGSNFNPCVDCRIYTLKRVGEYMRRSGASFIATGEVMGQRPMSQRKPMLDLVEKETGLTGYLLRPLCAKLLKPTIPEEKGWVDREKLYDISGRSRRPQMELAKKLGVTDYPAPAGGCLLTDPIFTIRLKDLLKHEGLTMEAMHFLKVGRHFRLSENTKAIVGRDQDDNSRLEEIVTDKEIMLKLKDIPGPITVLKGQPTDQDIEKAGAITAHYSKAKGEGSVSMVKYRAGGEEACFSVKPAGEKVIAECKI